MERVLLDVVSSDSSTPKLGSFPQVCRNYYLLNINLVSIVIAQIYLHAAI